MMTSWGMMVKSSDILSSADTIVIKIGSVLIREKETETVRKDWFAALAGDIARYVEGGKRVVIVSSGGIALGRSALGIALDTPPGKIPLNFKQAASAVGQYHMFDAYHQALRAHDIKAAQVLLTIGETENRRLYLNARETLWTLLDRGIVPVINENDTVSTGEIRFGDNDRLAARVAQMIGAKAVVLMSTIDGLYTANPSEDSDAEHIAVVEAIEDKHIAMAGDAVPGLSTGGMKSKLQAAIAATRAGIALMIADGQENGAFGRVVSGDARTSVFLPDAESQNARKQWIGSHMHIKGEAHIDAGAEKALLKGGSLLPVGVVKVDGNFERGDVIRVLSADGKQLATGISAYSAHHAKVIAGKKSSDFEAILGFVGRDELIHRDDLVLV
jgi:glutamate 5-kinase